MEWVEKTAASVHEAKEVALDALGVHEDDAEFDIVNEEKTGLFGRVKEEARVRARVRPSTPRAKDDRRRRSRGGGRGTTRRGGQGRQNGGESRQESGKAQRSGNGGQGAKRQQNKPASVQQSKNDNKDRGSSNGDTRQKEQKGKQGMSDEPTMPLTEQADLAEDFVKGLADAMGASVAFSREEIADDEIRITVTGDNIGRLIGQRGTAAMAVDDLVRTVLQRHGSSRDGRIRVDIGGLRARRAEALAAFCREQAAAVRADGKARSLEPMGGADRKVVHDTIADEAGVATTSEGEDPNRRVVIVPAGDAD